MSNGLNAFSTFLKSYYTEDRIQDMTLYANEHQFSCNQLEGARRAQLNQQQDAIMQNAVANWNSLGTFSNPQQAQSWTLKAGDYDGNRHAISFEKSTNDYEWRLISYPAVEVAKPCFLATVKWDDELKKVEPLTYKAFREIVQAAVKAEAPAVKVVTDCDSTRMLLWLELNKVKRSFAFDARREDLIAPQVRALCVEIREELGRKAVQC